MTVLDAEALATLTPEERAAIQDSEYTEAELAAMKHIAQDGDDDADDDDDDDADGGDDDADAQDEAPAPAPAPATVRGAGYDAQLPDDFADKVQAIKTAEAELKSRYKDGEIDFDEFEAQRETLANERETLQIARVKAEISADMSQQDMARQWRDSVDRFMATAARSGMDYRQDKAKEGDLDAFIKVLTANPENSNRDFDWFLTEADKRVRALHGVPVTQEAAAKPVTRRKPDMGGMPTTLAQVPGGDGPGDVAGEFGDVDGLDGYDLESAIARMSPAQRERYARA